MIILKSLPMNFLRIINGKLLYKYIYICHKKALVCTILSQSYFLSSSIPSLVPTIRTTAQIPTSFVCGRGGGASARKGVKVSRAGYGLISSLMVLFVSIQAVQPR